MVGSSVWSFAPAESTRLFLVEPVRYGCVNSPGWIFFEYVVCGAVHILSTFPSATRARRYRCMMAVVLPSFFDSSLTESGH